MARPPWPPVATALVSVNGSIKQGRTREKYIRARVLFKLMRRYVFLVKAALSDFKI